MRRVAVLLAIVLLAVLGGGALYWRHAARALEGGIVAWTEARRAEGLTAGFDSLKITGFPLLLRATAYNPVLVRPIPPIGPPPGRMNNGAAWAWRGSEAVAAFRPWKPHEIAVRFPGTHQITLPLDGGGWTVFATAARAAGTVRLDGNGSPTAGEMNFKDLDIASGNGGDVLTLGQARVTGVVRSAGNPAYQSATFDLSFNGKTLDLPKRAHPPLGRRISVLTAEASVMGVIPPGTLSEAAAKWRDSGGTVELHRLYVKWGPLEIEAGGTLALDKALQPMGALTAVIRGFSETIDALVAAGMVSARDGNTAKIVLTLMSKEPEGGGRPEITVPVTMQEGRLYVGPVRLMTLPKIRWG